MANSGGLNSVYTDFILEQSRSMKNKRELNPKTHSELGHNPSCGDEITLELNVEDGIIKDIAYTGAGCAISQASTSIMCDRLRGETVENAKRLAKDFIEMIRGNLKDEERLDDLGDAYIFESISVLPARVKCAVLAWYTLLHMLDDGESTGSFIFK